MGNTVFAPLVPKYSDQNQDPVFSPPGYFVKNSDLRAIHRAAYEGDIYELLHLKINKLNSYDKKKRSALHLTCVRGYARVAAMLIDKNCDLNIRDAEERTPLIKAVQCERPQCVTLLLERGADPNITDIHGNCALHYAAHSGNVEIATKLLEHGAATEIMNKKDTTPLFLALKETHSDVAELLIKHKANIHLVDGCKRTALMLAVLCNSESLVDLLLEQNINVFAEDLFGQTTDNYLLPDSESIQQKILEYKAKIKPITPTQARATLVKDRRSVCQKEEMAENHFSTFTLVQPFIPGPQMAFVNHCDTEEGARESEVGDNTNTIGIVESATQKQIDKISVLLSGHDKPKEPSLYLESISETLSEKDLSHSSQDANQEEKNRVNAQVEGHKILSKSVKEEEEPKGSENNQPQNLSENLTKEDLSGSSWTGNSNGYKTVPKQVKVHVKTQPQYQVTIFIQEICTHREDWITAAPEITGRRRKYWIGAEHREAFLFSRRIRHLRYMLH
ncbi:putative ankyrin repeat domain-containing protein 20A4 [Nycticebus coucang]|uniref:putative ankyrin repeat domain-containing protein 20A4 n=1 Tax=Nycticebus coucang TaxID=9470 RepID=UPI00234C530E|nr:putative ankyrin repeat domain-containing protein 20A4 [Nycticebus coucang]